MVCSMWRIEERRMEVLNKSANFLKYFTAYLLLVLIVHEPAYAQQGGTIFKDAACNLLDQVLTKDFGALLTVLAGLFALVSSVVGAFRMAWVLVFVSVGIYIFPKLVTMVFPLGCPGQ